MTTQNGTGRTIFIPATIKTEPWGIIEEHSHGHYVIPTVINVRGKRCGLGGWSAMGSGRIEHGGPMVPGPYAYAFGLCTAMCDNPEMGSGAESRRMQEAGTEVSCKVGDRLLIDRTEYRIDAITYNRDQFNLVKVDHEK